MKKVASLPPPSQPSPVKGEGGSSPARQLGVDDSLESIFEIFDLYYEKGWTDGLPIYPPTEKAVAAMLRYTDRSRDEVVAVVPPRNGVATVEKIAINAVMAGCRPEYLPILIAAVEAMVEPSTTFTAGRPPRIRAPTSSS